METKERIKQLLLTTERKGMKNLIEWMEEAGFFDAPCSSKYHLSEPGGLAKHSLNVFQNATKQLTTYFSENEDSITFDFVDVHFFDAAKLVRPRGDDIAGLSR